MSLISAILFIFSIVLIEDVGANDPYPDAVVALWRLDSTGRLPEHFLYIGALISSNCIFITTQVAEQLRPLNTIGFFTGRNYNVDSKMHNSAIIQETHIPQYNAFSILFIKPGVVLPTPYIITNPNYCFDKDESGNFIGWNLQSGPQNIPIILKHGRYLKLKMENGMIHPENFPESSFIVKGNRILGISRQKTLIHDYQFIKVFIDVTVTIISIFAEANRLQDTGENNPYPDAVVSFWRLNGGKRELLYVGALIASNWILFPRVFYSNLTEFGSMVLCTGRKYGTETHRAIGSTIVGEKEIPGSDRFIILIMGPGIRLPTPYIATNPDTCGKLKCNGNFIGCNEASGCEEKAATWSSLQGYNLNFEDRVTTVENFQKGSFMVSGKNIIAFFIGVTTRGELNFLPLFRHESQEILKLFESQNYPETSRNWIFHI